MSSSPQPPIRPVHIRIGVPVIVSMLLRLHTVIPLLPVPLPTSLAENGLLPMSVRVLLMSSLPNLIPVLDPVTVPTVVLSRGSLLVEIRRLLPLELMQKLLLLIVLVFR